MSQSDLNPKTKPIFRRGRAVFGDASTFDAELLQILLQPFFDKVTYTTKGQDVLQLVQGSRDGESIIKVVILNRTLEDMTGVDLTRQIRACNYAGMIIGTSAEMIRQLEDEWSAAGANAFLTKPIRTQELISLIESVL